MNHLYDMLRLETLCPFIVITILILGLRAYTELVPGVTVGLIALAGLLAWRASKTLIRFGWI